MLTVSSRTKKGLEEFWSTLQKHREVTNISAKRSDQRVKWVWAHVEDGLRELILEDPRMKLIISNLIKRVHLGQLNPGTAADKILENVRHMYNSGSSNDNSSSSNYS